MPHFKACGSTERLYDLGAAEMVRQVGEVILFCLAVSSALLFFLSVPLRCTHSHISSLDTQLM